MLVVITLMVKKLSKKAVKIIAIVVAVLLVLGVVGYIFRVQLLQAVGITIYGVTTKDTGPPLEESEVTTTIAAADVFAGRGDATSAAKLIDRAIAKTGSSSQKADLYEKKAAVIAGTNIDGAIDAMEQAVEQDPGMSSYSYLAALYERAGDYANAEKYYDLAYQAYNEEFGGAPEGSQIDGNLFKQKSEEMEKKQ